MTRRLAGDHRRGDGDLERSHSGPQRDCKARVGVVVNLGRRASRLAAEQQNVARLEAKRCVSQVALLDSRTRRARARRRQASKTPKEGYRATVT